MLKDKFDDFETQRQSDEYVWFDEEEEIVPEEYEDWLASIGMTEEELQADLEAQDRWYHETFEDVVWSDFLEQMTYAND